MPYRSVNFKFETYDREFYQSHACVNYPNNYDFTRIHEYKHYLQDKSSKTVIAKEYSEFLNLAKMKDIIQSQVKIMQNCMTNT